MGQPGAAQFATAVLERNHCHRKVMPSSWPALLRSCADGFKAQPSTGRATLTLTCAGANAAGAGAATILLSSAAPATRRRATCARSRGAPKDAARLRSLARRPSGRRAVLRCLLPGNRRGESGAAAAGGRWRSPLDAPMQVQGSRRELYGDKRPGELTCLASVLHDASRFTRFVFSLARPSKASSATFGRLEACEKSVCRRPCPFCRGWRQQSTPKIDHPALN